MGGLGDAKMSRPTIEMVEDNLITWKEAIFELRLEIDGLDREIARLREELRHVKDNADREWHDHHPESMGR